MNATQCMRRRLEAVNEAIAILKATDHLPQGDIPTEYGVAVEEGEEYINKLSFRLALDSALQGEVEDQSFDVYIERGRTDPIVITKQLADSISIASYGIDSAVTYQERGDQTYMYLTEAWVKKPRLLWAGNVQYLKVDLEIPGHREFLKMEKIVVTLPNDSMLDNDRAAEEERG